MWSKCLNYPVVESVTETECAKPSTCAKSIQTAVPNRGEPQAQKAVVMLEKGEKGELKRDQCRGAKGVRDNQLLGPCLRFLVLALWGEMGRVSYGNLQQG